MPAQDFKKNLKNFEKRQSDPYGAKKVASNCIKKAFLNTLKDPVNNIYEKQYNKNISHFLSINIMRSIFEG